METQTVIRKMMLEQCHKSLCDSGGAYGYQYEHRKKNGLKLHPTCAYEAVEIKDGAQVSASIDMYTLLCDRLEFDPIYESYLKAFFKAKEKCKPYLYPDLFEEFAKSLNCTVNFSENTYNYDNAIGGVFYATSFRNSDLKEWVVLATHNGCDVRVGYSTPHVFFVPEDSYGLFFPDVWARCECGCDLCEFNLENGYAYLDSSMVSTEKTKDKLLLKDDKLYCPKCGKELEFVW